MKQFICLLLTSLLLLSLASCATPNDGSSETTAAPTENNNETTPSTTPGTEEQTNPNQPGGYVFAFGQTDITVGAEAPALIAALGEPRNKIESTGCANFEGMAEIVYYYSSFQITTHGMNGKEIITSIYLEDDTVNTKEGICIGDSAEKVLTAYGEKDASSTDNNYVFAKGDMTVSFIITDGTVSSILYSLTV